MGIGEPSACHANGRFFQLADVLGVDKELGFTLSTDKYYTSVDKNHYISADLYEAKASFDFGESMKNVYATEANTEIIEYSDGEVHAAAHSYGRGCGVYLAGLPYSFTNTRLLLRTLYYAAGKQEHLCRWFASNPACEVHAYPQTGKYAVLNNSSEIQFTSVYDGNGNKSDCQLAPGEILWKKAE